MQDMSVEDSGVYSSDREALLQKVLDDNFVYFHDKNGFKPLFKNISNLAVTEPYAQTSYAYVQQKDSALTKHFNNM